MAITSFTGSFTDCAAKINEKSTEYGWEVTAEVTGDVSGGKSFLNVRDNSNNVLFNLAMYYGDGSVDEYGIRFYYNNGSSSRGYDRSYGSGNNTATLYFTSHGFICISNAYRASDGTVAAWLNVNDDGTVIYGGTGITSGTSNLYGYLIGCKYDELTYQALDFTPHTNPAGTTLCNATAVGSLGEPLIAKYMYYAPVYQSAITGEIEIDGERYVAYGGMWYLKD